MHDAGVKVFTIIVFGLGLGVQPPVKAKQTKVVNKGSIFLAFIFTLSRYAAGPLQAFVAA